MSGYAKRPIDDSPEREQDEDHSKHTFSRTLIGAGIAVGVTVGIALLLLVAAETVLRAAGWGKDRSPFIRREARGQIWHVRNFNFYRQFTGVQPRDNFFFAIPDRKADNTCRIIVLGSSAAADWPTVGAGFSSMLWLMLAERYPDVQFEVYNCADAGVNSHIMRAMAKVCARFRPDVFLVYTGNNELNGPFGIPTAMRQGYVPSADAVQWLIRLRNLRLTQLWEGVSIQPKNLTAVPSVPYPQKALCRLPGTPDVDRIIENYRENLTAICRAAAAGGARTVLCTLSVNLRDWAPEYPDHLKELSPEATDQWNRLFEEGKKLAENSQWAEAMECFEKAKHIDDTHAGLWWHMAQCLLRLGRPDDARSAFQAARDRDSAYWASTRSFLNDIVREVARQEVSHGVLLADVEKALAEKSEDGITGGEFIPDSCHFSFRGHWEAAQAMLPALEAALPATIRGKRTNPDQPISDKEMALLINYDPTLMLTFLRGVQSMVQTPDNRKYLQRQIEQYETYSSEQLNDSQTKIGALEAYCGKVVSCPCRVAFEMDTLSLLPNRDPVAYGRKFLAECPQYAIAYINVLGKLHLLERWNDLWEQSQVALELFPEAPGLWNHYTSAAEKLGKTVQVGQEFRNWIQRFPWSAELWYCLGHLEYIQHHTQEAADAWLTALLINPPQCLALASLAELSPAEIAWDIRRLPRQVIYPEMMPFMLACVDYLRDRIHSPASAAADASFVAGPDKAARIRETMAQTPFNAPAYWRDQITHAAEVLELEQRKIPATAMRQLADLFGTFISSP